MAFSFGFSGDDIERDPNDVGDSTHQVDFEGGDDAAPSLVPARVWGWDELLSTLPSKISYSTITLTTPRGHTARLPRRELFDVRLQLMAEDDNTSAAPLLGLSESDLAPNVYEGGFKTWECSLDLARWFLERVEGREEEENKEENEQTIDPTRASHIIEIGCGSALPSLVLFQHALHHHRPCHFTLTDYNADVLRLVTLPNLLLSWLATLDEPQSKAILGEEEVNPLISRLEMDTTTMQANTSRHQDEDADAGDVYLTPNLLSAFHLYLSHAAISLTFISGSWLPTTTFLSLIPSPSPYHNTHPHPPSPQTLILASETIYSPPSLRAFAQTITALMRRARPTKTVVAAKKVYFGVGGSVDEFREVVVG
ncbi:hypothetical protein IAQ61_001192, partial [Plenodomus lingam]